MALTELQRPTKAVFFQEIQHAASNMNAVMNQWRDIAEFIEQVDADDLTTMGVETGQVRTDLVNFRIAMQEMTAFFDGPAPHTQTNVPADIVDKVRKMK